MLAHLPTLAHITAALPAISAAPPTQVVAVSAITATVKAISSAIILSIDQAISAFSSFRSHHPRNHLMSL